MPAMAAPLAALHLTTAMEPPAGVTGYGGAGGSPAARDENNALLRNMVYYPLRRKAPWHSVVICISVNYKLGCIHQQVILEVPCSISCIFPS